MKKIIVLLVLGTFILTGCFKRDDMEDIDIYTTIYPSNYIISYLYGNNSKIYSTYPKGVDINTYKLSKKQLDDYSKATLFIFNSLEEKERDWAVELINRNRKIKIIDIALGMEYVNDVEETWLDPYNFLMMAQNVKNGLEEYLTNPYLIKEVENRYEKLKLDLSGLDAKIKQTVKEANYKTIVVDNDVFKFLEKYGLTVISLEENDSLTTKTIDDVKKLIQENKIDYIYTKEEKSNETVNNLLNDTDVELTRINIMKSIDGEVTNTNENYLTTMNNNLDLLKKELYKN